MLTIYLLKDSKPNIVSTDKVTSEVITGENITSDLKETDNLLKILMILGMTKLNLISSWLTV